MKGGVREKVPGLARNINNKAFAKHSGKPMPLGKG